MPACICKYINIYKYLQKWLTVVKNKVITYTRFSLMPIRRQQFDIDNILNIYAKTRVFDPLSLNFTNAHINFVNKNINFCKWSCLLDIREIQVNERNIRPLLSPIASIICMLNILSVYRYYITRTVSPSLT